MLGVDNFSAVDTEFKSAVLERYELILARDDIKASHAAKDIGMSPGTLSLVARDLSKSSNIVELLSMIERWTHARDSVFVNKVTELLGSRNVTWENISATAKISMDDLNAWKDVSGASPDKPRIFDTTEKRQKCSEVLRKRTQVDSQIVRLFDTSFFGKLSTQQLAGNHGSTAWVSTKRQSTEVRESADGEHDDDSALQVGKRVKTEDLTYKLEQQQIQQQQMLLAQQQRRAQVQQQQQLQQQHQAQMQAQAQAYAQSQAQALAKYQAQQQQAAMSNGMLAQNPLHMSAASSSMIRTFANAQQSVSTAFERTVSAGRYPAGSTGSSTMSESVSPISGATTAQNEEVRHEHSLRVKQSVEKCFRIQGMESSKKNYHIQKEEDSLQAVAAAEKENAELEKKEVPGQERKGEKMLH